MKTQTIRDLLSTQPVLAGLDEGDLDLMAGCAHNEVFEPGVFIAREGEPAERFFVVRAGRVGLEIHAPTGPLVVETLGAGELVGWSWIVPPHRWVYDVEVLERAHVVAVDAACLRDKCEADPAFGYRVMKRFAQVVAGRLQATRLRLLDLYGTGHGAETAGDVVTADDHLRPVGPMVPTRYRVTDRSVETADTVTLELAPVDEPIKDPAPGQFSMLYAFGAGEVPISISACPTARHGMRHTIRAVGATTRALCGLEPGSMVGVRGPFGVGWPVSIAEGSDVLVVGGGIGLAPLRPVVHEVLARRERFGRVAVLVGARTPSDVLYPDELERWRSEAGFHVEVTVDVAARGWTGNVGLVTSLLDRLPIRRDLTTAFLCGPEIMMRIVAQDLIDSGTDPDRILVSLERNMHCAVRLCGHCQLGPMFVCADGPVISWAGAAPLLAVRRW